MITLITTGVGMISWLVKYTVNHKVIGIYFDYHL